MAITITLTAEQEQQVLAQSSTVASLQAQVQQLQTQLTAANASVTSLTSDKAALQAKIDAAKTAAQKDKDADNANVAGQGVLDALA
jgi:uncharacterized protein YlxW (UPF0749 family)